LSLILAQYERLQNILTCLSNWLCQLGESGVKQ